MKGVPAKIPAEFPGPERKSRKLVLFARARRVVDPEFINRLSKLYKQCDDGGLAEGYSDRVVSLLTERWPTVHELAKLARANREFGDFVLLHVDDLMSPDQGRTIIGNAEKHCPSGAKEICKRLAAKARSSQ